MNYSTMFSLENKVIVVTGGCGLIGREFCKAVASHKGTVVIADLNRDLGEALSHELQLTYNIDSAFLEVDITSEQSVIDMIDQVVAKFGRIDGLVNNAYPRNKQYGAKFEDIELSSWAENIDMHLNGYFNITQKVAAHMRNHKSGVIVNLSSIYGILGPDFSIYEGTHMTMPAEYAAIKGGIVNLTRYLSTYLAPYNIRVNAISPGGIFDNQPAAFVEKYSERTPMGRMGEPEEMTGALIYLLSDASKFMTGQNLVVDGGWSAK